MGKAVGIDLGTTYSAVAIVGEDGLPEIVKNADGETTTPSVVLFQSFDGVDEPLVGTMAKHSAATDPDNVVQFVKRNMGNPSWRFDSDVGSYTAEEVSALVLKKLVKDAERELGERIDAAVITVPAYFDDSRRVATKHAGQIAGINVLRVLNEPTAAALSFGLDAESDGTIMVYDLGGGTFDVTLLRIDGSDFTVIATDGDRNLGGFDFDNALMKYVSAELEAQGVVGALDDYLLAAELREKCELAKRTLSSAEKTSIHLSVNRKPYRITVTREAFERESSSLLRRTEEIVDDVLDEAHISWDAIDYVVLVGGSTRMPMVRNLIKRISGKNPELGVNPDEAVALGAAVQAALEESMQVQVSNETTAAFPLDRIIHINDVTSQPLGVILTSYDRANEYNEVVIPRNSPVPGSFSADVMTTVDDQRIVNIRVTQGDDPDPSFVTLVGSGEISLPPGLPEDTPLRLVYSYDSDQTIAVELLDPGKGTSFGSFSIKRVANLDQNRLDQAIARINSIRIE